MKKFLKIVLPIILVISMCLSISMISILAEDVDDFDGWKNINEDSCTITREENGVKLVPHGTNFGAQVIANDKLSENIYGEYSFSADMQYKGTGGTEAWISIIGYYDSASGNIFRTGLHFAQNQWLNIASFGLIDGVNYNFTNVVWPTGNDPNANIVPAAFPDINKKFTVKVSYTYGVDNHIILTLYTKSVDATEFVKASEVDMTTLSNGTFTLEKPKGVGFDIYCIENFEITNMKVEDITTNLRDWKKGLKDWIYRADAEEFKSTVQGLKIDSIDNVIAYTENPAILSGMFYNDVSHNFNAKFQITSIEKKTGDFAYGFYPYYKDAFNNILVKYDGVKLSIGGIIKGVPLELINVDYTNTDTDNFEIIKKTKGDNKTDIIVKVNTIEKLKVEDIVGIEKNYNVAVFAKNIKLTFKDIETVLFYEPYDMIEQGNYKTTGNSETAWTFNKNPKVEMDNIYDETKINEFSIAIKKSKVNDIEYTFNLGFNITNERDFVYGAVTYYKNAQDFVFIGIENVNNVKSFICYSKDGVIRENAVLNNTDKIQITRNNTNYSVKVGEVTHKFIIESANEISEYIGYFCSGATSMEIVEEELIGFESYKLYENQGYNTSGYYKDSVKIENDKIIIDGSNSVITNGTEFTLDCAIKNIEYTDNYSINVDMKKIAEPKGVTQRMGVLAWYKDINNYFVLFIDQWTNWEAFQINGYGIYNGERMLDDKNNDSVWFLGGKDTPGYINEHKLKVVKQGQNLKCYNGTELIFDKNFAEKYKLNDISNAKTGVFASGIKAEFTNLKIAEAKPEEIKKPVPSGCNSGCNKNKSSMASMFFLLSSISFIVLKKKK